jgi:multimeric flavodoxin WrbA
MSLPPFVDLRHTAGQYPAPTGDLAVLLDATMAATDIVFVSPVYWYSIPSPLKTYLDHWSAWMRVPGLPFKEQMAQKTLRLITTSGDRAKAQPMIDSVRLCAQFLSMGWGDALWGKGGAPGAVQADADAVAAAAGFLVQPVKGS